MLPIIAANAEDINHGEHLHGKVVGSAWAGVDLAQDLSMTYTVEGRAGIYSASVVLPESCAVVLLASAALLALSVVCCRRRP